MKLKILLIALLILNTSYLAKSQSLTQNNESDDLEKSLFDLQIGLVGTWAAFEHKIASKVSMRYDIGISSDMWMGGTRGVEYSIYSQISAETRFYHHQISGMKREKNFTGNSGNFLSLKLLIAPTSFLINPPNFPIGIYPRSYVSIMPRYGIRRMITEHFHYELAFGLGYGYVTHEPIFNHSKHFLDYNVHIRIGYTF